jgi:hypothetical protein
MATQCLGIKPNGERCQRKIKDKSGYCHDHKDSPQAKHRSHAGDDSDDDDAKTVASSRSRPVTYKRGDVSKAKFSDDASELADDMREQLHLTRGKGDEYPLCFSYKTTCTGAKQKKGNGANNKVTRTKNLLIQDHGLHAHMRNGQDKLADDLRDAGVDVDTEEWWAEWIIAATQARLTVLFIDDDYEKSKACQKERNYVKDQKLPYLELNYKDYTSEHLAMMIQRKLKDLK